MKGLNSLNSLHDFFSKSHSSFWYSLSIVVRALDTKRLDSKLEL